MNEQTNNNKKIERKLVVYFLSQFILDLIIH
jgi:hypothetical protein